MVAVIQHHVGHAKGEVLLIDVSVVRNYGALIRTLIGNLDLLVLAGTAEVGDGTFFNHDAIGVALVEVFNGGRIHHHLLVGALGVAGQQVQLGKRFSLVVAVELCYGTLSHLHVGIESQNHRVGGHAQVTHGAVVLGNHCCHGYRCSAMASVSQCNSLVGALPVAGHADGTGRDLNGVFLAGVEGDGSEPDFHGRIVAAVDGKLQCGLHGIALFVLQHDIVFVAKHFHVAGELDADVRHVGE